MSQTGVDQATSRTLQLSDGRTLGYAEYGDTTGKPLFYFHGFPGSRLESAYFAAHAAQAGLRVIGIDRPGMGLSSFQPGRRLLDWPADVTALAEHLRLERFAVLGFSGGGPYALACAYNIPDRLTACGVVSGGGPLTYDKTGMLFSIRLLFFFSQRLPWLLPPLMWATGQAYRREASIRASLEREGASVVEPDKIATQRPEIAAMMAAALAEAVHQGTRGASQEARIYGRFWGFTPEEITCDTLYLWHGALDKNVPIGMGRTVAGKIAQCQATFYAEEGHFSTLLNHIPEILAALNA